MKSHRENAIEISSLFSGAPDSAVTYVGFYY